MDNTPALIRLFCLVSKFLSRLEERAIIRNIQKGTVDDNICDAALAIHHRGQRGQLGFIAKTTAHSKTKAMSPQTNGICERFHKTILNEFYQITFRKKLYSTMEELQKDLDEWIHYYNNERTHQGKMCCGRTPRETLLDGQSVWAEKNLAQI